MLTTDLAVTLTNVTDTVPEDVFIPWDNPDNVISLQTLVAFKEAMACGITVMLFLIGVPTNILNCIVFYRQGLRDRMNLCLFSLALFDMLFVFFFYMICSYCLVGYFLPDVEDWWQFFSRKYFTGLYRGFLFCSGCLTMLISVERCLCVLMPLKAGSLIKTRSVAILISALVLTLQCTCVLYPLQLSIGSRQDPVTGHVILFLASTEFYYEHKLLYNVVENTFLMVIIPFVNFIVVSVATTITVIQLRRAMAWRLGSGSSASDAREKALVKMLVIISIIFIVSSAPNVALGLTRMLVPEFRHTYKYTNIFHASHLMYLVLAMMNSSVNFFIYWARSSKFRKELHALLLCCAPQQNRSDQVLNKH